MPDELDRELTRMDVKYVRYADDFSIYCQEESEAEEVQEKICKFLKEKLHLPVNEEKSGIRTPEEFTIPGYGFERSMDESGGNGYHLTVKMKSWKTLKEKLGEVTRKTTPCTFDVRMTKLKEIQRGRLQYCRFADILRKLKDLDGWVRSRIRYCIWHGWKKPVRRCKSLIRMGINPVCACSSSHTRLGGWAVARSPILKTTITNTRLARLGYRSMVSLFVSITPHPNELAVYETRTYSDVRCSPCRVTGREVYSIDRRFDIPRFSR
jgi:hypothetical protein